MKAYSNNTTVYFFDGINTILKKYKASNWSNFSTSAVYTLAPGVIGHIISERKNNQDLYFHYDPIGNVQFITDCYGKTTVSYVQEGFGNVLATSGTLTTENWHLTSKQLELETGLYFFYARWYDPLVGRFITRDPAEDNSIYTYADDNPINLIDVDGNFPARLIDPGPGGGGRMRNPVPHPAPQPPVWKLPPKWWNPMPAGPWWNPPRCPFYQLGMAWDCRNWRQEGYSGYFDCLQKRTHEFTPVSPPGIQWPLWWGPDFVYSIW